MAKLTVSLPNGQVATRKTDREYTHVVISRQTHLSLMASRRNDMIAYYTKQIAHNTSIIERQGHSKHLWRDGSVIGDFSEYNVGCEIERQKEMDRNVLQEWERAGKGLYAVTWHQSEALAQREAAKRSKSFEQVHVLPVKE